MSAGIPGLKVIYFQKASLRLPELWAELLWNKHTVHLQQYLDFCTHASTCESKLKAAFHWKQTELMFFANNLQRVASGELCSRKVYFRSKKKKVGQTISDNRPQKQIELSSEDNFDDWELQCQNERCSLRLLSCGFSAFFLVLTLTLSHSDGPVIWCGQLMHIWVAEKHTFHMLSILSEWLVPPVKVLLFFSPFLSHISSFCSPSFFLFAISIAPTQGHPGHPQLQLYAKLS